MLILLSGRRHHCLSAVCAIDGGRHEADEGSTRRHLQPLSAAEIDDYVASGEAWQCRRLCIQGRARVFALASGTIGRGRPAALRDARHCCGQRDYAWLSGSMRRDRRGARGVGRGRRDRRARIELDVCRTPPWRTADRAASDIREGRVTLDRGGGCCSTARPRGVTQGAALDVRDRPRGHSRSWSRQATRAVPDNAPPADGLICSPHHRQWHGRSGARWHTADALEAAGWSELLDEAVSGEIVFAAARCA